MKQRTQLTLEDEDNFHSIETRSSETRARRSHSPLREFPHKAATSILNRAANLAIFIEVALGALAEKLFSLLPLAFREKLQRVNGEYLKYRNRLLRIDSSINNPSINNASLNNASLNNPNSNGNIAERKHDHLDKCLVIESEEKIDEQIDKEREQQIDEDRDKELALQRGDVPGWVLVVLMTTGLVTALWTIAAPRLSQILRNSLDSMNGIR